MKKLIKVSFLVMFPLLALTVISCQETDKNKALENEVMEVHDEVMPEMDNVMKLKKELKEKLDEADSSRAKRIKEAINELEKADEGMMNWMREYDSPAGSLSEEEAKQYLQQEKEKITKVKEQMKASQTLARALLESSDE